MSPFSPLRHALVLALLAAMSLSACGGADEDDARSAGTSEASTPVPSPSPTPGEEDAGALNGTPIRISAGDTDSPRGCTTTPQPATWPLSSR